MLQAGKYPWLVTVVSTSSPVDLVCAGTLVASKYVVTAAQCVYNKPPHALRFNIGDHDLLVEEAGEQQLRVADVMVHERYDPATKANDIALVELSHHLDLETRTPACLPDPAHVEPEYTGVTAVVAGWGNHATRPHEVSLTVVNNTACSAAMGVAIPPGMLCAGGQQNRAACEVTRYIVCLLCLF